MSTQAKSPAQSGTNDAKTANAPLRLDNAQAYLDRMVQELRAHGVEKKGSLVSVLEYLSEHIRWTRDQIGGLRPANMKPHSLSATTDQLAEVVGETAKAANDILSAAEEIERIAAKAPPAIADAIAVAVTKIYEASAFQDITGQRIAKVVGGLQLMESRIFQLIEACGPTPDPVPEKPVSRDEKLLNGPQLACNANAQQEIDKLFG